MSHEIWNIWLITKDFIPDVTKSTLKEFLTKTEISVTSDNGFTMEVYGDFRFWMVQPPLMTLKIEFLQICIFVFWSKWCGHIWSFQFRNRVQMAKTKICSENSDYCPISNSDSMSEITNFNRNMSRVRNYWLIKPIWTGLNQFVPSCQKLLINKKGVVKQNLNLLWFPAQLHLNTIW